MRRRIPALLLTAAVLIGGSGCSGDDSDSDGSTSTAPSREAIERDAALSFPDSMTGFRLTSIAEQQIDLTFQLPADDVEEFASESDLELAPNVRAVTHSPLWQNSFEIAGNFEGAVSEKNGVRRAVEVVPNASFATPGPPDAVSLDPDATTTTAPVLDPSLVTVRMTLTPLDPEATSD